MLFPQNNRLRQIIDLAGIWDYKVDKDDSGEDRGFFKGFKPDGRVAVPGGPGGDSRLSPAG